MHATFAEDLRDLLSVSVARHWIDGLGMLKLHSALHAHEALLLEHCRDVLPVYAPLLLKVCGLVGVWGGGGGGGDGKMHHGVDNDVCVIMRKSPYT